MAGCVRNIYTKNYQNSLISFQVTVKNVGDVFWTLCSVWKVVSGVLMVIDLQWPS